MEKNHIIDAEQDSGGEPPGLGRQQEFTGQCHGRDFPVDNDGEVPEISCDQRDPHSSSSDSEDEEGITGGYTLLPQGMDEELMSDWSASGKDDGLKDRKSSSMEVRTNWLEEEKEEEGEEEGATAAVVTEPDSNPDPELEDSQVDAIRQAMAGFSLPPSSVPGWAKLVPEEVWKSKLIGGLQQPNPSGKGRRGKK